MTENSPDKDPRTVQEIIDQADPAGSRALDAAHGRRNLLLFLAVLVAILCALFDSCFSD